MVQIYNVYGLCSYNALSYMYFGPFYLYCFKGCDSNVYVFLEFLKCATNETTTLQLTDTNVLSALSFDTL